MEVGGAPVQAEQLIWVRGDETPRAQVTDANLGLLRGVQAENDGLRADLDDLLAQLDASSDVRSRLQAQLDSLRDRHSELLAEQAAERMSWSEERDALAAHGQALSVQRDALTAHSEALTVQRDALATHSEALTVQRDALMRERSQLLAQQAELADLMAGYEQQSRELEAALESHAAQLSAAQDDARVAQHRLARSASAERLRHAEIQIAAYQHELRLQARQRRDEIIKQQVAGLYQNAAVIEEARVETARQTAQHEAEIDAIHHTFSWQVTRGLRAVRRISIRLGLRPKRGDWARNASLLNLHPPRLLPEMPSLPPADGPLVDVDYYRRHYPELPAMHDADLAEHFARYGRAEGRVGVSLLQSCVVLTATELDERERVVVIVQEAGLNGGAVAALALVGELAELYHVVTVLLTDGDLAGPLSDLSGTTVLVTDTLEMQHEQLRAFAQEIRRLASPRFAVATSVAGHHLATAMETVGVPVVAQLNVLPASLQRLGSLESFFHTVSRLIVPTQSVADALGATSPTAQGRLAVVAPSASPALTAEIAVGPLLPPTPHGNDDSPLATSSVAMADLLASLTDGHTLVIGFGRLEQSADVAYFLETASAAVAAAGSAATSLRFAWVEESSGGLGEHTESTEDVTARWWAQHGGADVTRVTPTLDLTPLWRVARAVLLTGRSEALPGTALAAAREGVPVLCRDAGTGFSAWLAQVPGLGAWVVPPHDPTSAAGVLLALLADEPRRSNGGQVLATAALNDFPVTGLGSVVDKLGRAAADRRAQRDADLETILVPHGFDAEYTGAGTAVSSEFLASHYLKQIEIAAPLARPRSGLLVTRPLPGFHPLVYAESAPGFVDDGSDPLAHFLRAGRPSGRWTKRLIAPDARERRHPASRQAATMSVLVHGHFHYPELLPEFLDLLAGNSAPVTLVLTTTSGPAAEELARLAREHSAGVGAEVFVVANRGRNLSALLSGPVATLLRQHDLVLHVHSKRSPHVDQEYGQRWRRHLWTHLVGDAYPLADRVIEEFAQTPRLGLVAPEDRYLNDWDKNAEFVDEWLTRLGTPMTVPMHFDFPLGAMFWARTAALAPLLDAGLDQGDFPAEPLPMDGTSLHALERLIALVVQDAGYEFAKTLLPSSWR